MSDGGLLLTNQDDEASDEDDMIVDDVASGTKEQVTKNEVQKFTLFDDNEEEDDDDENQEQTLSSDSTSMAKETSQTNDPSAQTSGSNAIGASSYSVAGTAAEPNLLVDMTTFASKIPNISDRFRNALSRVQSSAETDVEAWQALLNEAQLSFRTEWTKLQKSIDMAKMNSGNSAFQSFDQNRVDFAKFDLLESIYGALLQTFPFSGVHYAEVVELLLQISSYSTKQPIFKQEVAEIPEMEINEDLSTLLSQDIALELTRRRNLADRKAARVLSLALSVLLDGTPFYENMHSQTEDEERYTEGVDTLKEGDPSPRFVARSSMCSSHVPLWLHYIHKVTRDTQRRLSSSHFGAATNDMLYTDNEVRASIIQAYETSLKHAGFVIGCQTLWRRYINFLTTSYEKIQQQAKTNSSLTQAKHEQMLHIRNVFQRLIGTPMANLESEFWKEYEAFEQSHSEALAQALTVEHLPRMQHAKQVYVDRLAYAPITSKSQPGQTTTVSASLGEGPLQIGRLPTPPASPQNAAGMAMERALWTSWEKRLLYERSNPERLSSISDRSLRIRQTYKEAICVMMRHPEVWHEWAMWEANGIAGGGRKVACEVLRFATSVVNPTLLSDCALLVGSLSDLLEEDGDISAATSALEGYVHRSPCSLGYILLQRLVRRTQGIQAARQVFSRARRSLLDPDQTKKSSENNDESSSNMEGHQSSAEKSIVLDSAAGNFSLSHPIVINRTTPKKKQVVGDGETMGVMTWHVFAASAQMEYRINKYPEVAQRVYELGLKRHPSFLTNPSYVLHYANLLLDLGEEDNLRLLLERSIAACKEANPPVNLHGQRRLWNFLLRFESLYSSDCGNPAIVSNVEARRRDVLGVEDPAKALMPKSILDQLARSDGDPAGVITGGLGHLLDRYELTGLLGDSDHIVDQSTALDDVIRDDYATYGARKIDFSFATRHHRTNELESGLATSSDDILLQKSRTARDRAQPLTSPAHAFGNATQTTYPEWLRSFALLLPVRRFQRANAKPPPHLIEIALSSLQNGTLPPRPSGTEGSAREAPLLGKRQGRNGDSSDEETDMQGGGYGGQFRMRQSSRQALIHQ